MPLALTIRRPNHVTVIDCLGRIVAGPEVASLEAEVRKHLNDHCDVVLNLAGVEFVDSSGLGLLVRLATSTRDSAAAVRFCCPVPAVRRVIQLTMLDRVLQPYETEEQASASLQQRTAAPSRSTSSPGDVLCADDSADILSYLREGLTQAGYKVHSAAVIPDAMLLLKAMRPRVLITSPRFAEKLAGRASEMKVPMIELPEDFYVSDAYAGLARLVGELKQRLD